MNDKNYHTFNKHFLFLLFIEIQKLELRNPFSGYPNVVADKPNLGHEGPLTKIFSDIPTIFFGIYERSF